MPKTTFIDDVTIVYAAWLNKVFGLDGHNHLGLDEDGSAPRIDLEELSDELQSILTDLVGIRPLVQQLFFGDKVKAVLFGGSGQDGAFNGEYNLDREVYEFTNFTIPVGANIQVTGGVCRIRCTGNVVIEGALTGVPVQQFGVGKAWFNNGGRSYNPSASLMGSGGYETVDHTDEAGLTTIRDPGGLGGAAIIIEALGTSLVNGTISCNGGNAGVPVILSGSPVLGGAGGGSGGSITIQSYTGVQVNGTLDAIGGQGGGGIGTNAAGGGGGSGGWIRIMAPEINMLVNSVNVSGGLPGASLGTGARQGGGGGGFGGTGGNHKANGSIGKDIRIVRSIFNPIA